MVLALLTLGAAGALFAAEVGRRQLEQGLSRSLQVPVRIQRLTYTPGRLTLHNASFHPPSFPQKPTGSGTPSVPLTIHRLELEGSLVSLLLRRSFSAVWQEGAVQSIAVTGVTLSLGGMPLKAQGRVFLTAGDRSAARCKGWLAFGHPLLKGRVELSGPILEPDLLGWVELLGQQRWHFVSQLRLDRDALRLVRMEVREGWEISGSLRRSESPSSWEGQFRFSRAARSTAPGSRFELRLRPLPEGAGQAVLLMHRDGKVPQQLHLSWGLHPAGLLFTARFLGRGVVLDGRLDLSPALSVETRLQLNQVEMAELAEWLLPEMDSDRFAGRLQGQVRCQGDPRQLNSQGDLTIQGWTMRDQAFQSVLLHFRGRGPLLHIQNSHLSRPEGTLLMEGTVDLRRLGQHDFFRGVRLTSLQRDVEWGPWTVSPLPPSLRSQPLLGTATPRGLQVRRGGPADPVMVGLAYEAGDPKGPESPSREEMEVGVSLSAEERVQLRLQGEEQFLGIEHRKKF